MRSGQVIDLRRPSADCHDTVRTPGVAQPQRHAGKALPCALIVDCARNYAYDGESEVRLSPRQADVLALLARPGVVPSGEIIEKVWGLRGVADRNLNLKVQISNLRQKLKPIGYRIDSFTKRGYELVKEII